MPTISQLPPAATVFASDEIPISQNGSVYAASVANILATTQPAITVTSPSLVGRTSLGPGGPEQVDLGSGLFLSNSTLAANGADHALFSPVSSLPEGSDIVISNMGTPMLMQASLLRGLFSPGPNISIDRSGVISSGSANNNTQLVNVGSVIGSLQVVTTIGPQDLVAVSHAGSDCAIAYGNLIGGITIDQADTAQPAGDSDSVWVAQGGNVMTNQTFSAIWTWIACKLCTYRPPVVEVISNTSLDRSLHNGHILVCSQPVTLFPSTANMGNGFQCTVINASSGNVILGSGFISSSGSLILPSWHSASLASITYSAGTIVFAAIA